MRLETENVKETEASVELIRELMADDARRRLTSCATGRTAFLKAGGEIASKNDEA